MKKKLTSLEEDKITLVTEGVYQIRKRRNATDLLCMLSEFERNKTATSQVMEDIVDVARKQG
jgi:hypothetical protein